MERLGADHPGHRIGQLDLAARARFLALQHPHHLGLENIAARDDQVGGRIVDIGLFDQPLHFGQRTASRAGVDHAIARNLRKRHFQDT